MVRTDWRRLTVTALSVAPLVVALAVPGRQDPPQSKAFLTGKGLFAKTCAPCHGEAGAGGPGYSGPLAGKLTQEELGAFIAKNMPPGPRHASVAEARAVAAYMYEAFYSPLAQERNRPARIALQRLTVRQLKNAVADLVGDYHAAVNPGQNGLNGKYFSGKEAKKKDRKIERVDRQLDFHFSKAGPEPGDVDAKAYLVTWSGAIVAPDTGDFDLILETDQAAALYFNGSPVPTVDALVRSGNQTEFRATVSMLAGRAYPVYVEFKKWIQGVQDEKLNKTEATPAFIRLLWRPPKGADEVIPSVYLSTSGNDPTYVVQTAFPADDSSTGYARGSSISPQWDEALGRAAVEVADQVIRSAKDDQLKDPQEAKALAKQFVVRAFRQPLDAETERRYIDKQFANSPDLSASIKRAVVLALMSPRFLIPRDRFLGRSVQERRRPLVRPVGQPARPGAASRGGGRGAQRQGGCREAGPSDGRRPPRVEQVSRLPDALAKA